MSASGCATSHGLREAIGRRIAAEAAVHPFPSLADFHARIDANEAERSTLAEIGAFARIGGTRRQALWQVQALGRSGPLFDRGRRQPIADRRRRRRRCPR